jgi:hypothetical protein
MFLGTSEKRSMSSFPTQTGPSLHSKPSPITSRVALEPKSACQARHLCALYCLRFLILSMYRQLARQPGIPWISSVSILRWKLRKRSDYGFLISFGRNSGSNSFVFNVHGKACRVNKSWQEDMSGVGR